MGWYRKEGRLGLSFKVGVVNTPSGPGARAAGRAGRGKPQHDPCESRPRSADQGASGVGSAACEGQFRIKDVERPGAIGKRKGRILFVKKGDLVKPPEKTVKTKRIRSPRGAEIPHEQ